MKKSRLIVIHLSRPVTCNLPRSIDTLVTFLNVFLAVLAFIQYSANAGSWLWGIHQQLLQSLRIYVTYLYANKIAGLKNKLIIVQKFDDLMLAVRVVRVEICASNICASNICAFFTRPGTNCAYTNVTSQTIIQPNPNPKQKKIVPEFLALTLR